MQMQLDEMAVTHAKEMSVLKSQVTEQGAKILMSNHSSIPPKVSGLMSRALPSFIMGRESS